MPTNYKNSVYDYITAAQSVPASAAGTGTITTTGTGVTGTGTLFKSQMPAGSWIVDVAANELRKVTSVESDTIAYIDHAFTVALSAVAPNIIHEKDTNVVTISVSIPSGGAAGTVDGEVFPAGQTMTFSKDSRTSRGTGDYIDPIIVNAAVMLVMISK